MGFDLRFGTPRSAANTCHARCAFPAPGEPGQMWNTLRIPPLSRRGEMGHTLGVSDGGHDHGRPALYSSSAHR